MKKIFLLGLLAGFSLTGCIVYHPGPAADFGYTYDYSQPVVETPLPPRTVVYPAGAAVGPVVADEKVPEPPRTPPVFSDIPEPTPRPRIVRQTVVVPAPVVREPSGAQRPQAQAAIQQAAPVQEPAPNYVAPYSGYPGLIINATPTNVGGTNIGGTNITTNMQQQVNQALTNQPGFNPVPGATNTVGGGQTNTATSIPQQPLGVPSSQPQPQLQNPAQSGEVGVPSSQSQPAQQGQLGVPSTQPQQRTISNPQGQFIPKPGPVTPGQPAQPFNPAPPRR